MDFPHSQGYADDHGYSPGNGVTPALLSREPLATEGEATPGPDDVNPYVEREYERAQDVVEDNDVDRMPALELDVGPMPTAGDDPFVFDDVDPRLPFL